MKKVFDPDVSGKQNLWLSGLEKKYPDLQYAIKNGEKCIGPKRLKVDGYSAEIETAFEFDICYYHWCACVRCLTLKSAAEITAFNELMEERRTSTEKNINICVNIATS